jgi:hypothetical protein
MDARCTGRCSAWATISPLPSNNAHEKSLLSFIFVENEDLHNTTPISSHIAENRLLNISRLMGLNIG